ncbi:MAG: methyltransferase domain-containing protein [Dehalococcoidales bacterium]|nr:methyltransferase domain-containing protein [Dehalococcoidales bacterium]
MKYIKTSKYDKQFLLDNMMGPNAMKILEEMTAGFTLKPGMRVLDLGCGKGLTSIFLAKEFGVQVFAHDLWITATENYQRFKSFGLDNLITPIHSDALDMPYADEHFDIVVSADAYQYFGETESYMDEKLAPLVKKGGIIAIAVPGVKKELNSELPVEMSCSWTAEDLSTFHSCGWWRDLLSKSHKIEIESVSEMQGFDEFWNDWLECDNEYAISDRPAMEAGAGKYMNFVQIIAKKK